MTYVNVLNNNAYGGNMVIEKYIQQSTEEKIRARVTEKNLEVVRHRTMNPSDKQ